jgi:molybdenum-dependent DNA-binding transcriptional regulator ModE
LTLENQFQQVGRDVVLCQTQAEADESRELLTAAAKEHMGIFQSGNLGLVGFGKNLRSIITEHAARKMTLPGGKKVWMAIEREIDKATGEITVKRKQPARNESEATRIAQQWLAEYNAEKKKYFDAVAKAKALPPAPARCEPLTETDRGDMAKTEMDVLRRQWKHCFELSDKRKAGCHFSEDDCRKAYLLDLAEQGENPLSSKQPAGTDKEFWGALMKAGTRAARGKNKLLLCLVDYLIAFNWKLGWCYLSEKELAEKISGITKTTFTPGQIGKRRERLGLVAKHRPGPPFKFSP